MRYETQTIRIGENVGPVDWDHPIAKDMPAIWREAEQNPGGFTFTGYRRSIISICMYDGWPYWKPTPAVRFYGPIGPEWNFFNSYGVDASSIERKPSNEAEQTRSGTAPTVPSVGAEKDQGNRNDA